MEMSKVPPLKAVGRHWRDPSKLTPYEEKINNLKQAGMTNKQICAEIGMKNDRSICSTLRVIREKLEAQKYDDK